MMNRKWEPEPLPRAFYERPTVTVAKALLGKVLVHRTGDGVCAARIVETEAYLAEFEGQPDLAAHASRGVTARTRVIFEHPGYAYIYLNYGLHYCLNVVAEPKGKAGCVLIRAAQPVEGLSLMRMRRSEFQKASRLGKKTLRDVDLASGPGKLSQAMGIDLSLYGADLVAGPLTIHAGDSGRVKIGISPRIGIRQCAEWPLRFYEVGNPNVSGREFGAALR